MKNSSFNKLILNLKFAMKKNLPKVVFSIYLALISFLAYSQTGGVAINNNNALINLLLIEE